MAKANHFIALIISLFAGLLLVLLLPGIDRSNAASAGDNATPFTPVGAGTLTPSPPGFGQLPFYFIENIGQFNEHARFQVRGGAHTIWLTADGSIWITILSPPDFSTKSFPDLANPTPSQEGVHVKLSFAGANPTPNVEPFNRQETHMSYFTSKDPDNWQTNVPVWGGIRYMNLYPGIDLEMSGMTDQWQPRLIVHPGADLSAVRLQIDGADALALEGNYLSVTTNAGNLMLPLLEVSGASEAEVNNPFLIGDQVLSPFLISEHHLQALSDQPPSSSLSFSTFLGGSGHDLGFDIEVDETGAIYVAGETRSSNFPTIPGEFDATLDGVSDIFVAKLSADGTTLIHSTFLGGSSGEGSMAITVDGTGSVYVAGSTGSSDFPTTPGAFDPIYNGGYWDGFVAKLSPDVSTLMYSTFLGTGSTEGITDIAVDTAGNAYITGNTMGSSFPITPGAFDSTFNGGSRDVIVSKLNSSGSALLYSTFVGGSGSDQGYALAVDATGAVYIAGSTSSSDFPTTSGAFDPTCTDCSSDNGFVTKLDLDGSTMEYSTFLGGAGGDLILDLATDSFGAVYVTGVTGSSNFPTTLNAFDSVFNGGTSDSFVSKLNTNGSVLTYSSFLGGGDTDNSYGITVDITGAAYVVGYTSSSDFPTTPGAINMSLTGGADAFVTEMNPQGTILVYSTFLGGSGSDCSNEACAVTINKMGSGDIYIAGATQSSDFPTTPEAFDITSNGGIDAFVTMLNPNSGGTSNLPIILLPGIMGSRLVNNPATSVGCLFSSGPKGEIWPGLPYLALDYNDRLRALWLDNEGWEPANKCDNISPSGIFTEFFLGIPGVDRDYYQRFIIELQDEGYQVYPFAYDWRLDLERIAQDLDNYIATNFDTPVILVGHSLGGLVARQYTLNPSRAQNIEKVITVGTPYWGAPKAALHMRKGTIPVEQLNYLLINKDVRTFHQNAPTVMQILPSLAYFQQVNTYYMDGSELLNSYQATTDFFKNNGQNAYLLDQAILRHQAIDDFRQSLNVPYYILTANHARSIAVVREYRCWLGTNTCWEPLVYGKGDGTVPWLSARLSGRAGDWSGEAEVCTFGPGTVTKEHSELLADDIVIADIKRILQGLDALICTSSSTLANLQSEPGGLIEVAVWGDGTVNVDDSVGNFARVSEEGLVANTIPLSSYHVGKMESFITLSANETYTLTLKQQSDEPVLLRVTDFQTHSLEDEFEAHERAIFVDVPSASSGEATMILNLTEGLSALELVVDLDTDGTPDYILPPTSVLNTGELEDLSPPTTTITVQGTKDSWDFYTGSVTATVSAIDTGTNVLKSEFSLDGGQTWQIYTGPVTFVAEKVSMFEARSMDRAGNQEYPWPTQRLRPYSVHLPIVQR